MIKILDFANTPASEVFDRSQAQFNVAEIVAPILADVRERGDEAEAEAGRDEEREFIPGRPFHHFSGLTPRSLSRIEMMRETPFSCWETP